MLVDADTVAGWRRSRPSLAQLRRAVQDLHDAHPGTTVAVVADPALKWSLPDEEGDDFESAIVGRSIVCAPAGTVGGTAAWISATAQQVRRDGGRPLVVTDRAVGGVPVVRVGREGDRFTFDLDGAREVEARPTAHRRRRTTPK